MSLSPTAPGKFSRCSACSAERHRRLLAYPQEIIKFVTAIKGSSAFYVAHNHPSDNCTLSDADRRLSDAIGRLAKG